MSSMFGGGGGAGGGGGGGMGADAGLVAGSAGNAGGYSGAPSSGFNTGALGQGLRDFGKMQSPAALPMPGWTAMGMSGGSMPGDRGGVYSPGGPIVSVSEIVNRGARRSKRKSDAE